MYSNSRSTTKTSNKKKILYTALGIFVAAFLVIAVLELTGTTNLLTNNDSSVSEDDKFNQLPTEQEASAGDEVPIKQETLEDSSNESVNDGEVQNNNQASAVALVISDIGVYDGWVEVSAFTPDAIANGMCTLTFTSGSRSVEKTNLARADASSTICIDEPFPISELSGSNEWQITVKYKSDSGNYTGSNKATLNL